MQLFDLDDRVVAAVIAAGGTVIGALIQLRAAWRKQVSDRVRGAPVTKKARRGPVLAVGMLLAAAAVGGFAISQFWAQRSDRDAEAVRSALQSQVAQISATAERLERATMSERRAAGSEGDVSSSAIVTTTVAACRARAALGAEAPAACGEGDAAGVTLCTSLPVVATVTAVATYARADDSLQPWSDSRASIGQDVGHARFVTAPAERPESEQAKQVCSSFSSWNGEHAFAARMIVTYSVAAPADGAPRAVLIPVAGARP
jgi:hypothetical protein